MTRCSRRPGATDVKNLEQRENREPMVCFTRSWNDASAHVDCQKSLLGAHVQACFRKPVCVAEVPAVVTPTLAPKAELLCRDSSLNGMCAFTCTCDFCTLLCTYGALLLAWRGSRRLLGIGNWVWNHRHWCPFLLGCACESKTSWLV